MENDRLKKLQNLTEDFLKESEKLINEGWFDRASANLAGLGGSVQGLGQKIGGHAGKALGGMLGNKTMQKGGQQSIDKSKNMAYDAKYNTYIDSIINSVITDLGKLNIQVKNPKQLNTDIKQSIQTNTKNNIKQPVAKPSPATAKKQTPISTPSTTQKQTPISSPKPAAQKPITPAAPTGKILGRKGYNPNPNVNPNYVKSNPAPVSKSPAIAANAPVKQSTIPQPAAKKGSKVAPAVASKPAAQPSYNYNYTPTPTKPTTQAAQPITYSTGNVTKPKYDASTTYQGKNITKK